MKKNFAAALSSAFKVKTYTGLIICILCLCAFMSSANAAFFDDFEDGNHSGWLVSTAGGNGSTGVTLHNSSQMAYVEHYGDLNHTLSRDFSYSASDRLSFDMQALTIPSFFGYPVGSGVTISFLNAFNVGLGSVSLCNDKLLPGFLGSTSYAIDQQQHHYDMTLAAYAALAGLNQNGSISKFSLSFWTWGEYDTYALVYFDNVNVGDNSSTVPLPAAVWLFGSGLIGLLGMKRRKRMPL